MVSSVMFRPFFLCAGPALRFIRALRDEWEPDVILRDTAGLAAWAIAEQTDTPLEPIDHAAELIERLAQPAN